MHDIKIPDPHAGKKPDFEVTRASLEEGRGGFRANPQSQPQSQGHAQSSGEQEAGEKVKVQFKKFVKLVATHDFEEVMERYAEENIIVSTNLLTDLANAHEEPEESGFAKKLPIIFIVGVIIGVVLTYLVVRF